MYEEKGGGFVEKWRAVGFRGEKGVLGRIQPAWW